jgi:hypothetical protein
MQRPSIAGSLFLGIFGLPFAGMGLVFAFVSLRAGTNMPGLAGFVFGMFFACIGFGLIAAAIFGYRKLNQQADLRDASPDKPWVWREDWAAGRANGSDPRANITLWVFTAFWDFISITIAVSVLPRLLAQGDLRALLVLIFPIAGIFITGFAVRGTLRTMRYGRTSFWCDTVPFYPGGRVKGVIHLKLPTTTPHGIDLRLTCKRRIVTGSGKNQSVNELVLWQNETNVPAQSVMHGLNDAEIPVDFAIPADAFEANDDNPNDKVIWQLHANADVPGVDLTDNYELPVFRTQAAAAAVGHSPGFGLSIEPAIGAKEPQNEQPVAPPIETHVVYTENEQGTGFYFPPLRNPAQALGIVVFATIWSAVVYFLWVHEGVPWIFRIVFSLFEILVGYMLLSAIFGSALIRVREGALEVRSAILGIGTLQRLAYNEVASIAPLSQGRTNSKGEVLYGINIHKSDGRDINIAPSSLTETEAKWIDGTLERAMGRKQDTSVRFQSIYGAPPQRDPVTGVSTPGGLPSKFRTAHRKFGFIGFAIWLFFVGMIFYNVFSRTSSSGNRPRRTTKGAATPVPKTPMTDADVSRLSTLPIQQQAEELLERSINHDERALEMFESNIESWTSEVRLTDHMKQLDGRAIYSTDLRVRQAEADLYLAMEGWHRNQEAVDLLIQRADSDKAYRPSAYYFLGMEGGRGVDSDRVFGILRERALSDPDPVVRQWAVEGLRFYKTDEALEVLYQSFTTDASYNVRDRAGCNVSDCGIFTRAQRMRYVPKLIELAGDSSLNSQMRNWVYMTLNGITDASVSSNQSAWRKWYEEHGGEKEREFESLQWYQVKGDE